MEFLLGLLSGPRDRALLCVVPFLKCHKILWGAMDITIQTPPPPLLALVLQRHFHHHHLLHLHHHVPPPHPPLLFHLQTRPHSHPPPHLSHPPPPHPPLRVMVKIFVFILLRVSVYQGQVEMQLCYYSLSDSKLQVYNQRIKKNYGTQLV